MRRWARQGLAHRQNDGRMCNGRPVDESLSVDAWLQEIYESVAEWMPAASNVAASAVPALSEWLAAPAGPSVTTVTPGRNGARYLAHQSLQDLFYTHTPKPSALGCGSLLHDIPPHLQKEMEQEAGVREGR